MKGGCVRKMADVMASPMTLSCRPLFFGPRLMVAAAVLLTEGAVVVLVVVVAGTKRGRGDRARPVQVAGGYA
jgi:hypothetical protein